MASDILNNIGVAIILWRKKTLKGNVRESRVLYADVSSFLFYYARVWIDFEIHLQFVLIL